MDAFLNPNVRRDDGYRGLFEAEEYRDVASFYDARHDAPPTPLVSLPGLAAQLSLGGVHLKDESARFGLSAFKIAGARYAIHRIGADALRSGIVCATAGNHGRAVARAAREIGVSCTVFLPAPHERASDLERRTRSARVEGMRQDGARTVDVAGSYEEAVAEAAAYARRERAMVISDTSWPGYERIPGLVMQGYTAIMREALRQLPAPPTHVFVQAGVGGVAAAVAGHLALVLGDRRPTFVVVEPARAACLYETARAGHPVKISHGEPTVMAMLECYEPSLVAWRVLSRVADAFMTVDEDDAVAVMNRLSRPAGSDPAIVAGESGGVGLAGLIRAAADPGIRVALDLNEASPVFVINTEGATDPESYAELVGMTPGAVATHAERADA